MGEVARADLLSIVEHAPFVPAGRVSMVRSIRVKRPLAIAPAHGARGTPSPERFRAELHDHGRLALLQLCPCGIVRALAILVCMYLASDGLAVPSLASFRTSGACATKDLFPEADVAILQTMTAFPMR